MQDIDREDRFFRRGLCAVLLAAAALRILYFLSAHARPELFDVRILDSIVYEAMAERIASGDLAGDDVAYRLGPLYAYFLALLRLLHLDGMVALCVIQQGLGLGSIALTGMIGRRCFGARAGLAGAAIISLYGAMAMLELKVMGTTFACFLTLLGIHALLRSNDRGVAWSGLWPGLILGAACLARPNTLLFVPLAALWLLFEADTDEGRFPDLKSIFERRRLLAVLALCGGLVAAIAPATLRNHHVEGEWILISSQGGITFYYGNNERSVGVYARIPGLVAKPSEVSRTQREMAEREVGHSLTRSETGEFWRNKGLRFLWDDPGRALRLMWNKLRYWLGSDEISTEYVLAAERKMVPALWLMPLPFAAILGLGLMGLWKAGGRTRERRLLLLFLASNLVTVMLFYFSSRYRLPAVPLLAAFAGCGLVELKDRFVDAPGRALRFALPGLIAMGFSLVSFSDVYARDAAAQFANYGVILTQRGHFQEAVQSYEHAIEGFEDNWRMHDLLARSYLRAGDLRGAIRHHERALGLNPKSVVIRKMLERERQRLEREGGPTPASAAEPR